MRNIWSQDFLRSYRAIPAGPTSLGWTPSEPLPADLIWTCSRPDLDLIRTQSGPNQVKIASKSGRRGGAQRGSIPERYFWLESTPPTFSDPDSGATPPGDSFACMGSMAIIVAFVGQWHRLRKPPSQPLKKLLPLEHSVPSQNPRREGPPPKFCRHKLSDKSLHPGRARGFKHKGQNF